MLHRSDDGDGDDGVEEEEEEVPSTLVASTPSITSLSLSLSLSLLLDLGKQTYTERIKQAQFTDCRSENFSSKQQSNTTNLIEICFAHQLSHSLKLPRLFFTKKSQKNPTAEFRPSPSIHCFSINPKPYQELEPET
jgi:hypothetical protein